MKLAMLYILIFPLVILGFTAWSVGGAVRPVVAEQRRAARPERDPLRLHQRRRQQRLGLRRASTPTRPGTTSRLGLTMLIGRFLMIVPALAIAGSLVGKKIVPPRPGTFPTNGALFVGAAGRRDRHRRRADVLPRARAGPDRRALRRAAPASSSRPEGSAHGQQSQRALAVRSRRSSARPRSPASASWRRSTSPRTRSCSSSRSAACSPRSLWLRDLIAPAAGRRAGSGSPFGVSVWLWFTVLFANFAEAVAEGRGKAQAGDAAQDAQGDHRAPAGRTAARGTGAGVAAAQGRPRRRRGRRAHPRRRRGHRRHRLGRRVGDHRRVGAGHPRERRRPLGGHRRHQGALRPDRRAHHRRSRASRSSTA